jgi:AmmeMemoRadiSam system protein B
LTKQNYFTPWGVLPTASDVVDELAAVLGDHEVFAEELHHRTEHSIEIVTVWLHYLLKGRVCEIVPVLCGSFHRFIENDEQPGDNREIALFIDALRKSTGNRRALIVAAGDLAHVGPAFGDSYPIGLTEKATLSSADNEFMESMSRGDAETMFMQVKKEGDRRRICGLPPIYIALRFLGETSGIACGYAQCPADEQGTSFVSICGLVLS